MLARGRISKNFVKVCIFIEALLQMGFFGFSTLPVPSASRPRLWQGGTSSSELLVRTNSESGWESSRYCHFVMHDHRVLFLSFGKKL